MRSSTTIAVTIALLALIWIGSGFLYPSNHKASAEEAAPDPEKKEDSSQTDKLVEVRVRWISAEIVQDEVMVTGKTRASRKLDIRAETNGQVVKILVEKGSLVKSGRPIARLELRDRVALVREAEQLLAQRKIQYQAEEKLVKRGFNSRVRLAEAQAQLSSAKAQLKQVQVDLNKTTIRAPFTGILNGQFVEVGDYVSKENAVFSFVDLDPVEVEGFLTESQVVQVTRGKEAQVRLLNGEVLSGKITYISSVADTSTRTFPIEVTLANSDHSIREGLTANIQIPVQEKSAHKISPSILSLADNGQIGVKIVDDDDVVQFRPVVLLKDTPNYLWITGLPTKVQIITVGQEFVVSGQKVKPVAAEGVGLL